MDSQPTRSHDTLNGGQSKQSRSDSNGEKGNKCAWCLAERHIAPEYGSHGICQRHVDLLNKELSDRKPSTITGAVRR